jgi:NADH dehydrogenase (ubiquinone) Fe-S protein 6
MAKNTPDISISPPDAALEGVAAPHGGYIQPVPTNRLPPEIVTVDSDHVSCDGRNDVIGGGLGHPRVWLTVDAHTNFVDCGYCDRRFVLSGKAKSGGH